MASVKTGRRNKQRTLRERRSKAVVEAPSEGLEDADAAGETANWHLPPASLAHRLIMMAAIALPFLGCILAAVLTWNAGGAGWLWVSMLIGGWIFTGLGITVGFHRLLTHRSFDTYGWVRGFWMMTGALAVEGSPLIWCAVHRRHHAHSDQQGDPHSPHLHGQTWRAMVQGLWHAHVGWLFTAYWSKPELQRLVPDLLNDRLLVAVDRMYYLWVIASLSLPALIGGLITMTWTGVFLGFLWGGLVRIFMTHHITWSINSICHVFGRREYRTTDQSTNNWICGLLGLGEGWHNNHHAFPSSARHGLHWWQFDLSWIVILAMKKTGLAWNVHLPSQRALQSRRITA